VADVTIPTGSDHDLLTIIASMRAKPGKEQELRQAADAVIEPTRREDGCVAYYLHQGIDDPAAFYFYENWASPEALAAHVKTPHFREFAAKLEDLLAGALDIKRSRRIV
jgi:quinol monooxygenase YgiN